MRQGGALPQQWARKSAKRTMRSGDLLISSHSLCIPPSVCPSHPHFSRCFLRCITFCPIGSGAGHTGRDTKETKWKSRTGSGVMTKR